MGMACSGTHRAKRHETGDTLHAGCLTVARAGGCSGGGYDNAATTELSCALWRMAPLSAWGGCPSLEIRVTRRRPGSEHTLTSHRAPTASRRVTAHLSSPSPR